MHLSPTSKGCNTKRKTIASKIFLHVFPNINTTRSNWDDTKTSRFLVAIPRTNNQMMIRIVNRITLSIWWSLFTAVFVSLRDNERARLSLYTFTCSNEHKMGNY
jgi:hypothetical protein